MPSQEFLLMAKLVSQIYSRSDAEPFRVAVDWKQLGLFDYPEIIKKPMDLGQVKTNIENEKYTTIHAAANDVRLVWKNCMQYNADGSDFYLLAQSLSKRFEDKYTKLMKELNITPPANNTNNSNGDGTTDGVDSEPTIEEKRTFAKYLYKITKEELGKIVVDLDTKCPESLTKNQAEDEVLINVDQIAPIVFHQVCNYASTCVNNSAGGPIRKKKTSSGKSSNKKSRTA